MTDPQFTLDRSYERAELATLFRAFATALENDGRATIDVDGGTAEIEFPEPVSVRLASVREAEPPTEGLEIDLEWDSADERRRLRVETSAAEPVDEDADPDPDPDPEEDASTDGADEGTRPEPASSVMPLNAFPSKADSPSPESDDDGQSARRTSRFEVYRDRAGQWRWRLVHWNGNIIADSGEGYASRYNAVRAARGVMRATADARIEHLE